MGADTLTDARRAMALLPRATFLLTAAHEGRRAGQIVGCAQPCADEPMLICVAARKGHTIEPLIRDSRAFAICRIEPDDRLLLRKFGPLRVPESQNDPFDSIETDRLISGSPIPRRSLLALDCEVVRHLDIEADHELYIGLVLGGRVYAERT